MKHRCFGVRHNKYKDYGGRGITVCDTWKDKFIEFNDWALQNGYNDTLTIERENNDGNYCPENCKWIPKSEQNKNRRNSAKNRVIN
jgi:hypothetical protein